jgi:hypothetical protein
VDQRDGEIVRAGDAAHQSKGQAGKNRRNTHLDLPASFMVAAGASEHCGKRYAS